MLPRPRGGLTHLQISQAHTIFVGMCGRVIQSSGPLRYAIVDGLDSDPHDLLARFPDDLMIMWPISTRVNSPRNDDENLFG